MLQLNHSSLLKTKSFINGKWTEGTVGKTFSVVNPFDQQEVTQVAEMGAPEARSAIEAAHQAFPMWKALTPKERGGYLLKWKELISRHWDDLSALLTYEEGKPHEQSTHELMGCSGFLTWYAEEAKRLHGHTITSPDASRRFLTLRQPVGVVALITPWNFPSVLLLQKCAPALAAGCTVVLKPAEDTPLSALAHAYLAQEAGIPPGVFNVVACGNPETVGHELLHHPLVRKFSFTGSTDVGKKLTSVAAKTVKNVCLELGGNCPAIIFEDADLERAVHQTFWLKFYNAGQCCNNINRFLVHTKIYDAFIDAFRQMIDKRIKLGSGMDATTTVGPLINHQGLAKVEELVQDALSQGAVAVTGGQRSSKKDLFYPPTLLRNVTPKMRLYREEIFGPVAPIYSFTTEEEAIHMANDTHYGLAAYLFSENIGRMWRVTEALEAGSIGANTCDAVSELLPFGGWKESGIGRENGAVGSLDSYCEYKSFIIGGI
ncbi:MAG: NAD-dependent succinate-semialdehyde dehydrogenase [Chlamydiota bacterium]